jgi:hypothetical protein
LNKAQVKQTWFHTIHDHYESVRKQQNKRLFRLKVKLFLTVFLPIFIFALAIKVTRTFIQIKVRSLFTKTTCPFKDDHLPK